MTKKAEKMLFGAQDLEIKIHLIIFKYITGTTINEKQKNKRMMEVTNMKKNFLKKALATAIMSVTLVSSSMVANAATASTDFGTMTYSLTKPASNAVKASTSMPASSSTYSYVKTTLEVQNNSTGTTLAKDSVKVNYAAGKKITATVTCENLSTTKLAGFSCHEVVGKTACAKYLSKTF